MHILCSIFWTVYPARCLVSHQPLLFFVASHSAYTEAYNVCALAAGPQVNPVGEDVRKTMGEEDQGRTSEEDEAVTENNYDRQVGFLTGTLRGERRFYR